MRRALVAVAVLAAGCGGSSGGAAPTPSPLTMTLHVGSVVGASPSCAATPVARGRATTVVVKGPSGRVVASGRTSGSTTPVQTTTAFGGGISSKGCLFDFTAQVPSASSYHVTVSGKYEYDVTRAQVEQPDLRLFIEYRQGLLVAFPPANGLIPPG
jgi:hypothetical protein